MIIKKQLMGGGPCCNKTQLYSPTEVPLDRVPKALKINLEHQQFVHSKAEPTSNLTEEKKKKKKNTGRREEGETRERNREGRFGRDCSSGGWRGHLCLPHGAQSFLT